MDISFEKDALVVTIGAMGTGKSTFLASKLPKHHIVSTDEIRQQLCGDFESQHYNDAVFELLFATLHIRANAGLFTVVDSTGTQSVIDNVLSIARECKRPCYVLKFPELAPEEITSERMKHRMKVIDIYHKQVNRINTRTRIPSDYTVIEIPKENRHAINVVVGSTNTLAANHLDPQYRYMVVPDLHGEYWVFSDIEKKLEEDHMLRVVQLGDINDRGESSYKTFQHVYSLWQRDLLFAIPGNHDAKFYRWVKKWLGANSPVAGFVGRFPELGMKISHGLDKTLTEFMELPGTERDKYAKQVVEFHESLPMYLMLERDKTRHYFSHAGFSATMAQGHEPGKYDLSQALYGSIYEAARVRFILEPVLGGKIAAGELDAVVLNIGHTYAHVNHFTVAHLEMDGPYGLYSHDIGLGKRDVRGQPEFAVL